MTRAEIIGNLIIGIFLLIVGAAASPLLKRLWEKMHQPSPLTPQTRGELTKNLGFYEEQLARLNHLGKNQKDLFLYLFQLLFAALFLSVSAALVYLGFII
jgi:hypothetical protein